ncbi:hypothetical protein Y032_0053g2318 [Ancylostoma ceylanicum]|uniref:Chromatin assembly factor 1 subunit A n=1 Tax=Ancylostoma ceylanicum TaxID=53326 RepID=A0A016U6M5_9BILA|nr:hypothetical protein Y032_0053g2318 [Ancylostoma ceylanicum]
MDTVAAELRRDLKEKCGKSMPQSTLFVCYADKEINLELTLTLLITLTMANVDVCTKENDVLDVNGDARGVKRPPSSPEVDPVKKLKVEENDIVVLDDNESSPSKSSGRVTPSRAASAGSVTSAKKGTPKMTKEEREAEKARKALQKKLREEERERAKAEKERIAEEKRLEKERKEREREEKRKEEERKKEERRKEEEERKERKRKEEEEKQRKKEELAQKKREEEEKKEAKRREEEERREAKRREEEALEEKKRRESAHFMKFFSKVEKKKPDVAVKTDEELWYKPFEVKDGMTLAPIQRRTVLKLEDDILKQHEEVSQTSYLSSLAINPKKLVGAPINPMRAKLYQFHDNYRPPYYGTWRTRSKVITGRRPFSTVEETIDYEVDSDAEWEEEPSDAEECKSDEEDDAGGDSDVDSDHEAFFVEPGYLSDGEGDEAEEDAECSEETAVQHDDPRDAEERRERLAARAREWKSRVLGRKQPTVLVPRCVGPTYCAAATAASQPLAALTVVLF